MRISAKDPRLVSCIATFLNNHLPSVIARDPDTVDSYRSSINIYLVFMKEKHEKTLKTLTAADFSQANVTEFKVWLGEERGNVATTINHRLADIRGFCKYMHKNKLIDDTAYEAVREVGDVVDERVIEFEWLSIEDTKLVLDQTQFSRDPIRDRFMVSLAYESGARVNELLSLKLSDIRPTDKGEANVHFFGKCSKHRITPLSKEIWDQFCKYCEAYHPAKDPDALVFYTERNGIRCKMSRDNVARILKGCEERARKIKPELIHLHSHLFRRSRAMHLFEAGVPITTIANWLGHSSIESTQFYAKVTERMKRDALKKLTESDNSVFKSDAVFKYADDEETLMRLCGLK